MKSGHKIPHLAALGCSDVLNCGENEQICVTSREKCKIFLPKTRNRALGTFIKLDVTGIAEFDKPVTPALNLDLIGRYTLCPSCPLIPPLKCSDKQVQPVSCWMVY
jgi:hypothetical protein